MRRVLAARLLWIDALGGLGVGAAVLLLHDLLPAWYGLPAALVAGLGVANVAYGATSFALALTPRLRRPPYIGTLAGANVAWGAVCWWLLVRHAGDATALGVLQLGLEGTYVPLLGLAEWWCRRDIAATAEARGPRWDLLECRVPPPAVALATAAAMHALARAWPWGWGRTLAPIGILLAAAGAGLACWAIVAFRRAATTIHPLHPEAATALVTDGPNRWSRNPMYVGLLFVLAGWGVWLGSAAALLAVPLAWGWLRRFQVIPEERALEARFGDAYRAYRSRVGRWG